MKSQNEQQASLIQKSWEGAAFTIIGIDEQMNTDRCEIKSTLS